MVPSVISNLKVLSKVYIFIELFTELLLYSIEFVEAKMFKDIPAKLGNCEILSFCGFASFLLTQIRRLVFGLEVNLLPQ